MAHKFVLASKTRAKSFPPFIVEQLKSSLKKKAKISKCRQQGGLFPTRTPFIKTVHHIQYVPAGACLVNGLSHNPHYQIKIEQQSAFVALATSSGVPVEYYKIGDDWKCTNGVVFADMTAASNSHLADYFNQLDFEGDLLSFLDGDPKWKGDPLRTTMQSHYGFTGGHSLTRDNEEQLPRPQLIDGEVPKTVAEEMALLSALTESLYNDSRSRSFRGRNSNTVFGDGERVRLFANQIHPNNTIESLTKQVQSPTHLCKVHIDISNDGTDFGQFYNYDVTAIYWKIFDLSEYITDESHPLFGKLARVAKLCYSRRSVVECMRREKSCDMYIEGTFMPWFNSLPVCRKEQFPDKRMFSKSYVKEAILREDAKDLILKPCLNKAATFYSAFVDSFEKVSHESVSHGSVIIR